MTTDTLTSFLSWYFDHHPTHAAHVGSLDHYSTFGDFSASAFEERARENAAWLTRLEPLPRSVDRDLALSVLRGELAMEAAWPSWRRDPHEYSGLVFFGLLAPFLHRLLPEEQLVASTIAKLREVPSLFAGAEANLDSSLASPLVVRRALAQVRTGRAFLMDSLPLEVSSPELRAKLMEAAGPAADAFDRHAVFLDDLAVRATGDWRMGEKLYSTHAELDVPRPVEPEPVVDLCDLRVGRVLAGKPQCGIAGGQEIEDGKRDRQHARDDDQRPDEPPCDVEGHVFGFRERRREEGRVLPAPSISFVVATA